MTERSIQTALAEYLQLVADKQTMPREAEGLTLRRLSRLQREVDFHLTELRIEAAPGSDWFRAARSQGGCGCKGKKQ